jgi:hypothetical protein
MGFEKLEIITSVLDKQIENHEKTAEQMKKDMIEHNGARQALEQIAQQFAAMSVSIEERIEADLELGSAADKVLVYSKNIFARVIAICDSNAKSQQQQRFISQGRMEACQQAAADITKEILVQKAFLERRAELAREAEAKEAAAEAKEDVDTIVGKDKKPSAGNGASTKKKAAAKRKKASATKKKAAAKRKKASAKTKASTSQPKLPLDSNAKTEETDPKPDGDHTR